MYLLLAGERSEGYRVGTARPVLGSDEIALCG